MLAQRTVSPWVPALRSPTLARPGHESEGARDLA
jgi:hypothetical protein